MAIDYAVLANELNTDPRSYGYAPLMAAGNHQGCADELNLVRTGANEGPAILIRKSSIPSAEFWGVILMADMTALPASPTAAQLSTERRHLAWLTGFAAVPSVRLLNNDGSNTPIIDNLSAIFPAGSGTRTRLIALASRQGSRGEELFGAETMITHRDVAQALGVIP